MKTSSRKTFTPILWTLLFVAGNPMQAQQPVRPSDSITIDTDLVVTWVRITSRNDGAPVRGLGVDDFLLREEGKQQQISLVREDQPLSVVILVDAMACGWIPELEFRRGREALRQLGDDAEIALMAWDSDVVLVQPFTMDRNVISDRLGDKVSFFYALNGPQKVVRPERDLYRPGEAIYQAAAYLEKAAAPGRRKIIIIIANFYPLAPMAETHRYSAAEVNELLEKTGTTVYGLHLMKGLYHTARLTFMPSARRRRSGGKLEKFVERTGGSIVVGEKKDYSAWLRGTGPIVAKSGEADELLIKLTSLIRSSYSIGYYPENKDFDGNFRRIKLELSRLGKTKAGAVNINMGNGYRALRPSSTAASKGNLERY